MTEVENFIELFAGSWWLYAGILLVSLIDGFFPVVPSDAMLIAASTAWQQTDLSWYSLANPNIVLITLAAIAGAWCGDQTAYLIGSRANLPQWRIFKTAKGRATLAWAEHALEHRGTTFIIAARFIPMGRVAVNLSAGALRFPHRRFMVVDLIAVSVWALWSVALGTVAGSLFDDNLLLSITVGVAGGIGLGILIDKVLTALGMAPVELPELAEQAQGEPPAGKN